MRALAVTGVSRLSQLPDVPTFAEVGVSDDVPVWTALFAPAGTPARIVERLHSAVVRVLDAPVARERAGANAETSLAGTPAELSATVTRDAARMKDLVKSIGLPLL